MAKVYFVMHLEIYMKVCFTCLWLMEMENTLTQKVQHMKGRGDSTNNLEQERKSGQMAHHTRDIMKTVLSQDLESIFGLKITHVIRVNGEIT